MVAVVSGDVDRQVDEPVSVRGPDGLQQAGLWKRAETSHQAFVRRPQFSLRVLPPACGRRHRAPVQLSIVPPRLSLQAGRYRILPVGHVQHDFHDRVLLGMGPPVGLGVADPPQRRKDASTRPVPAPERLIAVRKNPGKNATSLSSPPRSGPRRALAPWSVDIRERPMHEPLWMFEWREAYFPVQSVRVLRCQDPLPQPLQFGMGHD